MLAGGIAHEFNNTLHVALAGVELAADPGLVRADVARHLAAAREALARAADLSRAMLRYAGREGVVRDWVDLAVIVSAVAARVPGAAPWVQLDERPCVRADGDAIAGIVTVLLENAAEATGGAGEVGVRVGTVELGADEAAAARPVGEVAPGRYAVVEVRDDGEGMDDATSAHMFDPFFSTRFTGRGLGLAAALGVARAHRGGFVVRSEPGRGTAVRLLVPLGDADA